jgi:type IV secretory pathway VirB10-like protein
MDEKAKREQAINDEKARLDEHRKRNRRERTFEFSFDVFKGIAFLAIAASTVYTGALTFRSDTNQPSPTASALQAIEAIKKSQEKADKELHALRDTMQKAPAHSGVTEEAHLQAVEGLVKSVDGRLKSLEDAILMTPATALSIPYCELS